MIIKHLFLFLFLSSYQMFDDHQINNYHKKHFKTAESYNTYTLADIEIEGNTKYNKKQILEFSQLKIGDKIQITNEKANFRIKKLWDTNLFNNINTYIHYINKDKIALKISLEDLPILYSLKLIGIKKYEFNTINKKIHIKVGMIINKKLINNIENDIKKYFYEIGYPDVIIYCRIYKDINQNNILNIHVNKRSRIKISKLIFEGNQELSYSRLCHIMKNTKQYTLLSNIFNNSKYIFSKYRDDCNDIINEYQSLGFRDAKIISDTIRRDNKNNFIIKIKIKEGKRFYIGKIIFVGNNIFSHQFLSKKLCIKPGDIYNLIKMKKNILNEKNHHSIISTYLNKGYLFSSINIIEKAIKDNIVNIEIRISEGEKFFFNNITFSGNNITKDHVIIRNIMTRSGDNFSKNSIYDTLFNFYNLGFFESEKIFLDIKPYLSSHYVDIRWKLFEKNTNHIQLQGGYGSGRFIGSISLNIDNFSSIDIFNINKWTPLPQGDGEKLSLVAKIGSNFKSYGFSFIKPYLSKNFTSFNIGLNNAKIILYDNYKNINKGFLKKIGIYLGINKKINFINSYLNIDLISRYDRYNRIKTNLGIKKLSKTGISNDLSYTLSLQRISYGKENIFPINGSEIDLYCIFTFPYSIILRNQLNLYQKNYSLPEYLKVKIKIVFYKEILNKIVTKIGGEFGVLGDYDSKLNIIPFHRFYLGGTGTNNSELIMNDYIPLRGYYIDDIHHLKNDVGGVIYNRIFTEIRYPIIMNEMIKTWMLCFFEAGNTTKNYNNYNPFHLKKSIGTGIRLYMSPFGFLGFDLGYGFDNIIKNSQSKLKSHFIIGSDI